MLKEVIHGRGHKNVTGVHPSTFEITSEEDIGPEADCIIIVSADKSASSLSEEFKKMAKSEDAYITATIMAGGFKEIVKGWGSPRMTFEDERSMVFRLSDYVCGRTVMIDSDRPAAWMDRRLIDALARGEEAVVEMTVERKKKEKATLNLLFPED